MWRINPTSACGQIRLFYSIIRIEGLIDVVIELWRYMKCVNCKTIGHRPLKVKQK